MLAPEINGIRDYEVSFSPSHVHGRYTKAPGGGAFKIKNISGLITSRSYVISHFFTCCGCK